ncbi:MAG TPA: hypothetical protein VHW26_06935 [Solirubrobacteraceae bacterium]|jgi:hypothetical protein|nr:hypothetical protein [Solirubrobacteraceae bacterium]
MIHVTSNSRRTMLAISMTAVACVVMLAIGTSRSSAAASCGPGPTRTHDGRTYQTKTCPNTAGVGVYEIYASGKLGPRLDTMRSTTSWFACQERFASVPNPALGVGRNHYWLWTEGDDNGTWGWFPANGIKLGGQEAAIPGVPIC